LIFFVFALLFAMVARSESLPEKVTIGFLPNWSQESLRAGTIPVAKELQNKLGVPVSIYMAKSYSSLIQAMKDKKVDFAFLTSLSYVVAEKQLPIQVLLKKVWANPFYYSVILTHPESKITKMNDLKNKKLAFVDNKSTSGYLYPFLALKKNKLDKSIETRFSGSHGESVKLLENKSVDAIAVFADDTAGLKTAWQKFAINPKQKINLIWVSEPIPNDPFCVSKSFYDQYPKLTHSLMVSLTDAFEKFSKQKEVSNVFGAQSFMPATSRQYDPVRELAKELGDKAGL
jgi:phosphonate transport system substrate-binding protein